MAGQAHGGADLYGTEHGTLTERTTTPTGHEHGQMDIADQKRTFEGFIKFWVYLFAASALILIFLGIFAI